MGIAYLKYPSRAIQIRGFQTATRFSNRIPQARNNIFQSGDIAAHRKTNFIVERIRFWVIPNQILKRRQSSPSLYACD